MSKAKQIAQALATRLATITTANGYQTNIGTRVYRGKLTLATTQAPCIVIREGDDARKDEAGRSNKKVILLQRFGIEGHAACADPDHPNDTAHDILADIKKCVFNEPEGTKYALKLGGLADDIHYEGRAIGPREDGVNFVAGLVEIDIEFVEDLTNP